MLFYSHPACFAHDPGPGHAECPARLEAVVGALRAAFPAARWREAPPAPRDALLRVHAPALIAQVLDETPVARRLDPDTVMSDGSPEAARRAAGAALAAVDAVFAGEAKRVFCAVRPPGHHATPDTAMGFCLFNAVAVAAAHALAVHGVPRVAIVDFDVHHGNGTQDIFDAEPRVLFASTHEMPLYPGTGDASEHGRCGGIVNRPLPAGAGGTEFRAAWGELLARIDAFAPSLVLVSAGFDAHRLDPLAHLQLEADDYRWIGAELAALADRHAGGRLVSLLEGGYSLDALRTSSVAYVEGLGG